MLRALAAEVELQMAEEERTAAAALKNSGSKGSVAGKKASGAVDGEEEELDDDDDDDEEERGGEAAAAASSDCASALVLSREPGWHSSLFRPSRRLRQGLPPICETGRRPSMWSLICSLFGKVRKERGEVFIFFVEEEDKRKRKEERKFKKKLNLDLETSLSTKTKTSQASHDLHSVSVPAHFNEPLTETQRHVEIMQHSHLLDAAAEHPPESPARLLAVFGFACSLVSTCVRTSKPFKDLQGGTFEMVADDDDDDEGGEGGEVEGEEGAGSSGGGGGPAPPRRRRGRRFRALAEKVQHSPPVVAFCVQGERWTFEAHDELHVELSLRGLKMHPRGACRLTFIDGDDKEEKKEEEEEQQQEKKRGEKSPPHPPPLPRKPDEYRWNTPAFYVRDIVPSGSPGHMMRVSHKGPFFAKCMATGDAVVAVAAEAEGRQARAAAARGRALMSSVSGRYEPGPGRPAFAAEISGRLDGVVTARVRREHTLPPPAAATATAATAARGRGDSSALCSSCAETGEQEEEGEASCSCSCSPSSFSASPLLGCDPERFDGGGGRGFTGHAREALSPWHGGGGAGAEGNSSGDGGGGGNGGGGKSDKSDDSSPKSPFVLLPLFRGTTAHHRSQRGCGPWGMSPWACSLNDCPDDLLTALPLTDARRRRDVALVERGDGDAADAEKERMEARQRVDRAAAARALREWKEARARERRRGRKEEAAAGAGAGARARGGPSPSASGEAEGEEEKKGENGGGDTSGAAAAAPPPATTTTTTTPTTTAAAAAAAPGADPSKRRGALGERPRPFGAPRWFRSVPGTDVWGNPYSRWVYSGGYWEARERGEWPRGTRDPYA